MAIKELYVVEYYQTCQYEVYDTLDQARNAVLANYLEHTIEWLGKSSITAKEVAEDITSLMKDDYIIDWACIHIAPYNGSILDNNMPF